VSRPFIILCLIVMLFSCQSNPFDIEIEQREIDFQFVRLDQEVFKSEMDNPFDRQQVLLETYPVFYKDYFENILRVGPVEDSLAIELFDKVSHEVFFKESQEQVDSFFFDDRDIREKFRGALQYYSHYFPEDEIPQVYGMNSGFNYAIYPLKNHLAIGLEFYLGKDHYITNELPNEQFPNYQKRKMDKEYLVADALRGYLLSTNQGKIQGNDLLNHFVYQGKVMYALNALMPFEEEYRQMGYLSEEMDWCNKNEFNIWKAIIDEDLLFSQDFKQIQRFTGFGPFTQGFPEDSPGMISIFIGKRIVMDFMEKNPSYSMSDLFNEDDKVVLKTFKPDK